MTCDALVDERQESTKASQPSLGTERFNLADYFISTTHPGTTARCATAILKQQALGARCVSSPTDPAT
jgi:hypothetical protein